MAKNRQTGELFGTWDFFDNNDWGKKSLERVMLLNERGFDIFMVCNPVDIEFVGSKPADKDILSHDRFFIDLDPLSPQPTEDQIFALRTLGNLLITLDAGLPTSTDVHTGNGYQLHYKVATPVPDTAARIARLLSVLAEGNPFKIPIGMAVNVDTCTSDASRLCRFPYTINHKTGKRGSFIVAPSGMSSIDLSQFEPVPELAAPAFDGDLTNLSQLAPRLTRLSSTYLFEGVTEARHKAAYAAAANLRALGAPEEMAMEWVLMGAALCKPKPLPREDAAYCVRSAYKKQV